ncbi:MAG: DMT family transporter [Desulfurococcales archaeon]|nr:DMT family transporter [Desulfurococcales archaeon]
MNCSELGYITAFLAGLFFGLSDTLVRAASVKLKPFQNLLTSLLVGTPILWAASLFSWNDLPSFNAIFSFILAGILNFIVGRYLFYLSISYAGATTASIVTSPTVVFASLFAWILLGETLTKLQISGVFLVMIAVYLVYNEPSGKPFHGGRSSIGILAGLASALVFSLTSLLVRFGAGYSSGNPVLGAAISYSVALILLTPFLTKNTLREVSSHGRIFHYMIAAAIIVAIAQLFRYTAFSVCNVARVSVLITLFPIYTLLFSMLLSSELREKPGLSHIASVIIAVIGVILASG